MEIWKKICKPAVFAIPYVDVAIFRALTEVKSVREESTSQFGINDNKLYFSVIKNMLEVAKKIS